ncbi:Armadillo-type fold [Pseudocohnilembus persalinus]|uniref:Armadillo-type fold n=1 Tax=Pseudocohnilembus persalinus TaxID=266149 RepID=A0A0V0Q918_PSEPJ|nr:Armadillo-type fold [Pseudocohnilembus persalinus]|eukprot:KRW98739.1 Armadillo-type fold [Pseudocohnilembus persalinus]
MGFGEQKFENLKILSFNQDQELQKLGNFIKYNLMKIMDIFLNYYLKKEKEFQQNFENPEKLFAISNNFIVCLEKVLTLSILKLKEVVQLICQDTNILDHIEKNFELNQNLSMVQEFLLSSLQIQKMYNFYSSNYASIIVEIILPLIKSTNKIKNDFQSHPEEFSNFQFDIVNQQKSATFQTVAAQILQEICQCIDGSYFWLYNFCTEYMFNFYNLSTTQKTIQSPGLKYNKNIQSFQNSYFFQQLNKEDQIDAVLLALLIISPKIIERNDLMKGLDIYAEQMINENFTCSYIYIIRVSQFMEKYLTYMFQDCAFNFSKSIQFLLNTLFKYQDQQCILSQIIDTLFFLFQQIENEHKVEITLHDIIGVLKKLINKTSINQFFELLKFMTENYSQVLEQNIFSIVVEICNRLESEIQSLFVKNKYKNYKNNHVITKLLEILESITGNNVYMDEAFIGFEQDIYRILENIEHVSEIGFDLQLLNIMKNIMEKTYQIDDIFDMINKSLEDLFQKYCDQDINDLMPFLLTFCKFCQPKIIDYNKGCQFVLGMIGLVEQYELCQLGIQEMNVIFENILIAINLQIQSNNRDFDEYTLYEEVNQSEQDFGFQENDVEWKIFKNYYLHPEEEMNENIHKKYKELPFLSQDMLQRFKDLVQKLLQIRQKNQIRDSILDEIDISLKNKILEVCQFQVVAQSDNQNENEKVIRKIIKVKKSQNQNQIQNQDKIQIQREQQQQQERQQYQLNQIGNQNQGIQEEDQEDMTQQGYF